MDSVPFPPPRLLDGGLPLWNSLELTPYFSEPDETDALREQLLAAGCQIITAPDQWTIDDPVPSAAILARTRAQLKDRAETAGLMTVTGLDWEPFGDTPYLELVSLFAERAICLASSGAQLLIADGMTSLGEARAALMGARQCRLPVWTIFSVDEEGKTPLDADILACVITLQSMGAAAIGFDCSGTDEDTMQQLHRMASCSSVPIIVRVHSRGEDGAVLNPEQLEAYAHRLLCFGASILSPGPELSMEEIAALRRAVDSFSPEERMVEKEEGLMMAACSHLPFFLSEDRLEFSEPILCSHDMSDEVINAEDTGCDVLVVRVDTVGDAYNLGLNTHMFRVPVCILASSEEALDAALLYFSGRAIIDRLSVVNEEAVDRLVRGYGALLL